MYQSIFLPYDCLVFICIRVCKAIDLTGLTSEQTVEVGSNFVTLVCGKVVTLCASCLVGVSLVRCKIQKLSVSTLNRLAPFLSSPLNERCQHSNCAYRVHQLPQCVEYRETPETKPETAGPSPLSTRRCKSDIRRGECGKSGLIYILMGKRWAECR